MGQEQIRDRRFWLGLVFVFIGTIWLLDNLNIIPYYITRHIFSWQMLLIGLGLYFIVGRNKFEPGIVLITIGTVFLLRDYYYFSMREVWPYLWPSIFIIIGASLLIKRARQRDDEALDEKKNDVDYVDDLAIFGGGDIIVDSQAFKGGKVSAVFGGSNLDLRQANLAEGNNVIDVFCMFGGSSIIVPQDWTVKVDVFSIFGGFNDKRDSSVKVVPHPNKVLTVKGFVMFGGGDVKFTK